MMMILMAAGNGTTTTQVRAETVGVVGGEFNIKI